MSDAPLPAATSGPPRTTDRPLQAIVTPRSFVLGLVLTALYAWLVPLAFYKFYASNLNGSSVNTGLLPPGVVALFMLVIGANALLVRRQSPRALNTGELVVAFAMVWVGALAFQIGIVNETLSIISAPWYLASPENRWEEYYLAYIPVWAIPSNTAGGIREFFNGLPLGGSIPWDIWFLPSIWWGSLILTLIGLVICLMTIVHEQWHDHEKLSFPMADIPLSLIGPPSARGRLPGWLGSRMFWVGAAIPLAFIVWNIFYWFNPLVPRIAFTQDESGLIIPYIPNFYTKVDFFTIGLAYYAPLQVLRGFWIGRLLIGVEMGIGNKLGFGDGMNPGFVPWSDWGSNTAAWQCYGSLMMFVLWGFWVGREHFGKVVRSAIGKPVVLPDHLRRRYRAAVWGLCVSLAYLAFWFHAVGMSWPVVVIFLPMMVLLTLGMSKIIAESCFVYIDSPVNPQSFIMQTVGTAHLQPATMAALALSYIVFRSNHGLMMPHVAFAGRMGDENGVPRGRLYAALGVAVLVTIMVATATTLLFAYDVGAFNFRSHAFRIGHAQIYDTLARMSDEAFTTDWYRLIFFGAGMALMAAVIAIRTRFINFWLHPVGLTFATTSVAGLMTINIFLAWMAKGILNRIGGIKLVNRAKPLFLGLICGHALGVALAVAVDMIWFPGNGHLVLTGWGTGG